MFAMGLDKLTITVPTAVPVGDSTNLLCQFDLGDDNLYSTKWYKGRREFYRYTAKEIPHIKVFPVSGFIVDVSIITNFSIPITSILLKAHYYHENFTPFSGRPIAQFSIAFITCQRANKSGHQ